MKPIPTIFRGITYRSRLEARWQCFFDSINLSAQYEPEGFVLESGTCYLPDFWLPQVRMFAEIKPEYLTPSEQFKCEGLTAGTHSACLFLIGAPALQAYRATTWDCGEVTTATYSLDIHMHEKQFWGGRLYCEPAYRVPACPTQFSPEYLAAVNAARVERFGVDQ